MNAQLITKEFKFGLDACDENGIVGWIIDINNPGEFVEVEVFIDAAVIAKTLANVFRQDLLDAGMGNGNCAFHIPMPGKFFDGIEHTVKVKEIITGVLITSSPKTFTLKNLRGGIDRWDENGISGWAIDMAKPQIPVALEILIDDELIAKSVANIFRQDLLDFGIGSGNCAFQLSIPDKFWDGMEHTVTIQETLTKTVLPGSPKTFKLINKLRGIDNKIHTNSVNTMSNAHQELEEENALLLAQLHKIQEELERYYLQHEKAAANMQNLTLERDEQVELAEQLRSQILTLTQEHDQQVIRINEQQSILEQLMQEREEQAELLKNIKSQCEQAIAILNVKK